MNINDLLDALEDLADGEVDVVVRREDFPGTLEIKEVTIINDQVEIITE